ncbi:MAG TPA: DCC1-like thiol-disulfide oxidoreductase family protein [Candidatus Didemnitutus sp.]|nr:DCC1-like thiol-disulfide oxidoreductase family protein [Candidatus Didemnitutus sp.]
MGRPVLLYDGECGLCNWVVRRLLATDKNGRLHFAPLQSAPARDYLKSHGLPPDDFSSLVFVEDWDQPQARPPLLRTDGALAAAAVVGGVWRMFTWLRVLPRWLRDPFYKLVARTRYAIFGAYRPRPLPNPEWESRFL